MAKPVSVEALLPSGSSNSEGSFEFGLGQNTPQASGALQVGSEKGICSDERWLRVCEILYRAACRTISEGAIGNAPTRSPLTAEQGRVLHAIQRVPRISPEKLLVLVPMSRSSLTRILAVLRKHGLVERTGKTRKALYTASAKQKAMTESESETSCMEPSERRAPSTLSGANE